MEHPRSAKSLYERDFVEWVEQQLSTLRSGHPEELDILNVIEELEGLVAARRNELKSRLRVLMAHLLKCRFQPDKRSRSWLLTIVEQRHNIEDLFVESPSLKRIVLWYIDAQYPRARKNAALEMGLPLTRFPAENPFSVDDVLTDESDFTDPVD